LSEAAVVDTASDTAAAVAEAAVLEAVAADTAAAVAEAAAAEVAAYMAADAGAAAAVAAAFRGVVAVPVRTVFDLILYRVQDQLAEIPSKSLSMP